ncbi:MAG: YraN family protein [Halothece sp.]
MTSNQLGKLGEDLTAQWLKNQGCEILASRWRCRWGELDLVAYDPSTRDLSFVEVKTRQKRNWDENGLLAITPQKQQKLYRAAETFLAHSPQFSTLACRFDLVLIKAEKDNSNHNNLEALSSIEINRPVNYQGYRLILATYLKGILE